MTVENILLDCDPGLDDAAAIFLAAGSPRIHVLGITTVAGNQTIERVTKNAFFVAKMAGMGDVPIARGSARPLLRPQVQVCSEIHGETGLGVPVAMRKSPRAHRQSRRARWEVGRGAPLPTPSPEGE